MDTVTASVTKITANSFNSLRENVDNLLGIPSSTTVLADAIGYLQGGTGVDTAAVRDKHYARNGTQGFAVLQDDIQNIALFLGEAISNQTDVASKQKITANLWNNTIADISILHANRFVPAVSYFSAVTNLTISDFQWNMEMGYRFSYSWNSVNECRAFFNGGGTLNFSLGTNDSSTAQNLSWANLLTALGTIEISAQQFYDLTTSFTQVAIQAGAGVYSTNTVAVNAAIDAADPTRVLIEVVLLDNYSGADDVVSGTFSVAAQSVTPQGNGSGFSFSIPTIGTTGVTAYTAYGASANPTSVDETPTNNSVTFTGHTVGVATGTTLYWALSGTDITAGDFTDGNGLSGSATTDANGEFTVVKDLAADGTIEGVENMVFSVRTGSVAGTVEASITAAIQDTSAISYTVSAPASGVEGSSFTFTITPSSTGGSATIPWLITGAAAPFFASTSGSVLVEDVPVDVVIGTTDNGIAEGPKVGTFSAAGDTANFTLTDSALSAGVSPSVLAEADGATTFTVTGTNIPNGTYYAYCVFNGTATEGDMVSPPLIGSRLAFNITSNSGSFTLEAVDDASGDPNQTFTLVVSDAASGGTTLVSDTITITEVGPTYTLSRSAASVNEGGSFTITLNTTQLADGTTVPYTITGIQAGDITQSLTGNFTVVGNTDTLTFTTVADATTEGNQTFTISAGGDSISVVINDTSLGPAYSIAGGFNVASVNEDGSTNVVLTVSGENVPNGTTVPYALSGTGITSNDISLSSLSGSITMNSNIGTLTFTATPDSFTEGTETLTATLSGTDSNGKTVVAIPGGSLTDSVNILDTSQTPPSATYTLSRSATSVNEGGSFTITLNTTNVPAGTNVPYTITGIQAADITQSLTGSFVATNDTITFNVVADNLTEGNQTFLLSLNNGADSISVVINDTSTTPVVPSYTLTTATSITEGNTLTLNLAPTNPNGETVNWSITGDTAGRAASSGTFGSVTGNDSATVSIAMNGQLQGAQTWTITATGASSGASDSTTVTVNDATQSVNLVANQASIDEGQTATYSATVTNPLSLGDWDHVITTGGGTFANTGLTPAVSWSWNAGNNRYEATVSISTFEDASEFDGGNVGARLRRAGVEVGPFVTTTVNNITPVISVTLPASISRSVNSTDTSGSTSLLLNSDGSIQTGGQLTSPAVVGVGNWISDTTGLVASEYEAFMTGTASWGHSPPEGSLSGNFDAWVDLPQSWAISATSPAVGEPGFSRFSGSLTIRKKVDTGNSDSCTVFLTITTLSQ